MIEVLTMATVLSAANRYFNRFVISCKALFIDIGLIERLWAGGTSGLTSVGLFELSKNTKGDG